MLNRGIEIKTGPKVIITFVIQGPPSLGSKLVLVLFLSSKCHACTLSHFCLFNPLDCSLPGSSAHTIFQARILEWVAVPSPGHLPHLGIESNVSFGSCIGRRALYHSITWEALLADIVLLINFWFCCLCFWCFIQKKNHCQD